MTIEQMGEAKFKEYKGPFFPPQIEEIHTSLYGPDSPHFNAVILKELLHDLPNFKDLGCPMTSDGYMWFWAAEFGSNAGTIQIMFPAAQDWDRKDGYQSDRHVALYIENEEDPSVISGLLDMVRDRLAQLPEARKKYDAQFPEHPEPGF